MVEDYLAQGIAAVKSGKKQEARRLLGAAIRAAPDDERTWGWFYNVCNSNTERIYCLNQILRINPQNQAARRLLNKHSHPEQPEKIPQNTTKDKIPERDFKNDILARKVTRFLVIFEASALVIGFFFILIRLSGVALFVAFISFFLLAVALIWFYIRYGTYPIIQEKKKLQKIESSLKAQILAHSTNIKLTQENREKIKQAEQTELSDSLINLQKKYIRSGMTNTRIDTADIPGVGPGFKQKLISTGYSTAASITPAITNIRGFGPAKTNAVLEWKNNIQAHFIMTKPTELPADISNQIRNKYQVHHVKNDAEELKAKETKTKLENNLKEIQPRIKALAPYTFSFFIRHALGSKGIIAGLTGAGLIVSQICLGSGAFFSAISAALPTNTQTPANTLTLTITITPTMKLASTDTDIPTITLTPTITETPALTYAPTSTFTSTFISTLTSINTNTLEPTIFIQPTSNPIIPGGVNNNPWGYNFNGGSLIYDPPSAFCSYFNCISSFWNGKGYVIQCVDGMYSKSGGRSGACSGHGGKSKTLYAP